MATSGSFSGSIRDGGFALRVDWNALQNVTDNTSTITAVLYLVLKSGRKLIIGRRTDNTITIDGTTHTWTSPAVNATGVTLSLDDVTTAPIPHNADGSKSITISAKINIRATISGTYYESINASATIELDTIPRATQPNVNVSSAEMGSTVTIGLPRASASFTHDLYYKFGSSGWVWIEGGVGAYKYWAVPHLESSIPNAPSGILTIRAVTKNGSITIGTKEVQMTAAVPASCVPTITKITIADGQDDISNQFGMFVQNKSTLSVSIEAAGVDGSIITEYYSYFGGLVFKSANYVSDLLTKSEELRIKVKDSRGKWSEVSSNQINVVEYEPPKIDHFAAYRTDANGTKDEDGKCVTVEYSYSVSSLGGKNTATAMVEYKQDEQANTEYKTYLTDTALSATKTRQNAAVVFSADYTFDIRFSVADWFGFPEATSLSTIPSGYAILDIRADGKAISFGKASEHDGADFGFPMRLTGGEVQPILEAGTNLDNVILCGRYTGQNVAAMGYLNAPISAGSFDLTVSGNGQGDGLFLKQVFSFVRKTDSVEYTRYYFSGGWGEWVITGAMGNAAFGVATLQ